MRAAGVATRPRVRGDVGYFACDIAWAAVNNGCDFSLGVMRNKAVWRELSTITDNAWRKAKRMRGAQVAVMNYAPKGWPPGSTTVVRRVKVKAAAISTDPRAPRRRTIPADQLALALAGEVLTVYAYSFIITNLDVSTPATAVALEAWHRMRTDIEDRIRDAKHGAALRHLPSGSRAVNTGWMWAALLAINLSAWLQELGRARRRQRPRPRPRGHPAPPAADHPGPARTPRRPSCPTPATRPRTAHRCAGPDTPDTHTRLTLAPQRSPTHNHPPTSPRTWEPATENPQKPARQTGCTAMPSSRPTRVAIDGQRSMPRDKRLSADLGQTKV